VIKAQTKPTDEPTSSWELMLGLCWSCDAGSVPVHACHAGIISPPLHHVTCTLR